MFKQNFTRREPESSQEAGLVTSAQGKVLSFPGDIWMDEGSLFKGYEVLLSPCVWEPLLKWKEPLSYSFQRGFCQEKELDQSSY